MSKVHPCYTEEPALILEGQLLRCGSCGAFQRLNPETGNLTWIRSGRVISAPQDMIEANERHERAYGFKVGSDTIAVQEVKDDENGSQ